MSNSCFYRITESGAENSEGYEKAINVIVGLNLINEKKIGFRREFISNVNYTFTENLVRIFRLFDFLYNLFSCLRFVL